MNAVPSLLETGHEISSDVEDLRAFFEAARQEILRASSDDDIRYWCGLLMTRLYETGVALAGSESAFHASYPERFDSLQTARQWSEHPSAHIGHLLPFLKTFGRWLIREAERHWGGNAFALPRWRRFPTSLDSLPASRTHRPGWQGRKRRYPPA